MVFRQTKDYLQERTELRRVFLHACCGPCAEAPILDLIEAGVEPTLFYFNPNIYPEAEWQRREAAVRQVADLRGIDLIVEKADRRRLELGLPNLPKQCNYCYMVRLDQAAMRARELGFEAFSTSLLVSPYQNRDQLIKLGQEIGVKYGLEFLAIDWRPLFRLGQRISIEHNLYRQKYCACYYSLANSKWRDQIEQELLAYG